jgi:UDP-GlcNAc:undecaprenyl-phosphate GlcNAc-1-phosphate transferase
MDFPFVLLFLASIGATVAAMPLARILGAKVGLLDHPHERKLQSAAVPRTGGIGIFAGLAAGALVLIELSGDLGVPITREVVAILVGGALIHLTGVLDDLLDLPAVGKFLAQIVAVGLVIANGVLLERIELPGGFVWSLGWLAVPATAFFLLGFINSVNLVDGLDGLASGIAVVAGLALGLTGVLEGNYLLASLGTILFGAVLGFLPFNFARKKTFLGDAGSMLIGYLIAVIAIAGTRFSGESTSVFVALACGVVPILDTATTIARRARNGRGIFEADAMHIHHRMIRFGLSPRRTVLVILALTLFSAGQCLVFFVDGTRLLTVSTSLAAVLILLQMRFRHRRVREENGDATFHEIVLYLLGAQDGRYPHLDGKVALADVIASGPASPAGIETSTLASSPVASEVVLEVVDVAGPAAD